MDFKFKKDRIKLLYTENKNAHKYPTSVVENFFDAMAIIDSVNNEQELYSFRGMRFEKLLGKRGNDNQRSIRLNNQWRLIVSIEKDEIGKYIFIIDIVDYHKRKK